MRTGGEVAVFVTRRSGAEVLLMHRVPLLGGYWHVVAGGIEPGEAAPIAAARELWEETGLKGEVHASLGVSEYVYSLSEEPAERRDEYDPSVVEVRVECFWVNAPDDWEPTLNSEHDDHRWFGPDDAVRRLRWPETARALAVMLGLG